MSSEVIAICGKKGHGKDVAAQALSDEFENIKFAGGFKTMLRAYLAYRGAPEDIVERMLEGDLKEAPSLYFEGNSTRHAMETLGTSWGRDMIGKNIWTNTLKDKAAQHDKVVITDLRFLNEQRTVNQLGALTIKIIDPRKTELGSHVSETEMDLINTDKVILNDGSIDKLHLKMREIT